MFANGIPSVPAAVRCCVAQHARVRVQLPVSVTRRSWRGRGPSAGRPGRRVCCNRTRFAGAAQRQRSPAHATPLSTRAAHAELVALQLRTGSGVPASAASCSTRAKPAGVRATNGTAPSAPSAHAITRLSPSACVASAAVEKPWRGQAAGGRCARRQARQRCAREARKAARRAPARRAAPAQRGARCAA
jgi:hypothetical protein